MTSLTRRLLSGWTSVRPATRPKVFGIGLPKTGTTTLAECMRILGYKHHTYDMDLAASYVRSSDPSQVISRARRFESFDDWPWQVAYRELDSAFPGSRFISTRRTDVETYLESERRHRLKLGYLAPTQVPRPSWWDALVPDLFGQFDRELHRHLYEQHYAGIDDHFHGRESDVLRVCWEEGDGWPELCDFLGRPRPDVPFPHANSSDPDLEG